MNKDVEISWSISLVLTGCMCSGAARMWSIPVYPEPYLLYHMWYVRGTESKGLECLLMEVAGVNPYDGEHFVLPCIGKSS